MTRILKVHSKNPQARHIQAAAESLNNGHIVLAPMETGYSLFGDAALSSTHSRFLSLRQAHPKHKPFTVLCRDLSQINQVANFSTPIFRLATRLLPGPFTLILEANRYTAHFTGEQKRKTVGVRISSHPVSAALAQAFERPLLMTSVTDAEELMQEHYYDHTSYDENSWWAQAHSIVAKFRNAIDLALDLEEAVPMRVSTVIDFTQSPPEVVRDGGWGQDWIGSIV